MSHLDSALDFIRTALPPDWTSQFSNLITSDDDTDVQYVLKIEVQIASILDNVANLLFNHLNLSLISGEYVTNLTSYDQKLTTLENYLRTDVANFDLPNYPQMTAVAQEVFKSNFFLSVTQSVKKYRSLLDFVGRHLVFQPNTSTIFSVVKNENERVRNGNSAAKEMSILFQLGIKLALIDHSICFKEKCFVDLLLIEDQLKSLSISNDISEILKKKCGFLLYKISFRLQESHQNYLYAIDFNYSTVQLNEIAEFDTFNDIIKGHYDQGIKPSSYRQRATSAKIKFEQGSFLSLNDYHALTKHFKDVEGNLAKLVTLKNKYEQYYNQTRPIASSFDQKALDVTFCYIENNILSLELDTHQFTLENWVLKLKEYTDRAEVRKNKNFFPYYKIINKFLKPEIEKQLESKNYNLARTSFLIQEYEKHLKSLIENLGICEETDYLAFQNNYDDCKVQFNNTITVTCFISSSFVLPLNYKKLKEEIEEYRADLLKFKSMYEIEKMIEVDRRDVKQVKQEIEKTDKRHIEILSIFAALVMFVSSEIQIFSKIPNMADAVAYTLFFVYGLGLFVLMIWFITRPEGVRRESFNFIHWFMIVLFTSGFIAAIIYVSITKSSDSRTKQLQYLQFKIDSLQKQKMIDTLSRKDDKIINDSIRAHSTTSRKF